MAKSSRAARRSRWCGIQPCSSATSAKRPRYEENGDCHHFPVAMLSVRDLDLYYGDAQALDRVSLEVPQGAIVAIVGANGAGKSSLIRSIAGIEMPRAGAIIFNGEPIAGLGSHVICDRGIGQVAEGRQVFPSLTVLENLEMGAMIPRARPL